MQDRFTRFSLCLAAFAMFAACSGSGSGGMNPTVTPTSVGTIPNPVATPVSTAKPGGTPTPVPVSTPGFSQAAFTCPTSNTASSSVRSGAEGERSRRAVARYRALAARPVSTLEVTYASSAATRSALATREASTGAHAVQEIQFAALGRTTRFVAVGGADPETLAASLRAQTGVISVAAEGARRHVHAVTTPYYPNDPYFNGFLTTLPPTASSTAPPPTYHVPPYSETNDVPGQWNMHAIGLEKAFAYSQSNNGSVVAPVAGALGSSSVKVALIDTGADTTIPELSGKIVATGCFITNPNNVQSASAFETDPDGHGTDTAGIAGASFGNGVGFTGAGGRVSLEEYRVSPTPDDACLDESTSGNDPQCGESVADIGSAITAAVDSGANVINLSLGTVGAGCTGTAGVDDDPAEGNAIAAALAKNVIVVASAGNNGTSGLSAPACVSGVIAAGASALADGTATGSGSTSGTVAAPVEYVASYSQYGSPGASVRNANAWGIVAPGGDPANSETTGAVDDLHWIEDTWTSTPVDANYAGSCGPDYPDSPSDQTGSCRTLIAGTSMSAPTIAGAAALIISANPSYGTPAKMKALLCTTADEINDAKEGCGRLNVYRAMATAVGDPTLP